MEAREAAAHRDRRTEGRLQPRLRLLHRGDPTHLEKVPADYIRKQTLVNAERFVPPELQEVEGRVLRAQEGRAAREEELFLALRDSLKGTLSAVYAAAEGVAELDALLSFAELAAESG